MGREERGLVVLCGVANLEVKWFGGREDLEEEEEEEGVKEGVGLVAEEEEEEKGEGEEEGESEFLSARLWLK